jgi:hypothetical protein
MRAAIPTIAALGTALSARRDLLLEILALRHQFAVLSRSDRRFRPADRLLWVCLRRWWPRWKEALVLVQPATVARWHREGLRRCWSRRSSWRPGRPRIDSDSRPHPTDGRGEPSLGRSVHPRPAAEARNGRLGTDGIEVSCQHSDRTVTKLADISHQPLRPAGRHLADPLRWRNG